MAKKYAYTEKNKTWKIELKATSPAQYSVSPFARSFQTMTIAMQRARPMRMRPSMYSGLSRRNTTASPNMSSGPMIQFCTSDSVSTRLLPKTLPSSSYRTFASGGYIISTRPMAIGMEVVPTLMLFSAVVKPGARKPRAMPNAIAAKIHSVR